MMRVPNRQLSCYKREFHNENDMNATQYQNSFVFVVGDTGVVVSLLAPESWLNELLAAEC